MRIGYLKIMQPMQGQSEGYVVLCWHRKAWWQWGLWWNPNKDRKWGTYGWRRARHFLLGRFGEIHFQHQY